MPSGRLCAENASNATAWIVVDFSGSPLTRNAAVDELEVVGVGLHLVRGDLACLLDDLLGGAHDRLPADRERARAVGVHAVRRPPGVAVDDLDVIDGNAEEVARDLAPRRLVTLAVRRGAR